MEKFFDGDKLLAIVFRGKSWEPGLHFQSPPELALQVGTWHYPKDKELRRHSHKEYPRSTNRTQEVSFVVHGSLEVQLFSEDGQLLHTLQLDSGDYIHQVSGGHGYRILAEDTKVLEVKSGPFLSAESDKNLF